MLPDGLEIVTLPNGQFAENCYLLADARSREAAEKLQAEIGPASCRLLAADLSLPDAASALWRDAEAATARIDVLVNNAGIFAPAPIAAPMADWQKSFAEVMQVNLTAPAELCKLAVGHFRVKGGGKLRKQMSMMKAAMQAQRTLR